MHVGRASASVTGDVRRRLGESHATWYHGNHGAELGHVGAVSGFVASGARTSASRSLASPQSSKWSKNEIKSSKGLNINIYQEKD